MAVEILRGPDHMAIRTAASSGTSAPRATARERGAAVWRISVTVPGVFQRFVQSPQALGYGARQSKSDNCPSIDLAYRRESAEGPSDEGFLGRMRHIRCEITNLDGNGMVSRHSAMTLARVTPLKQYSPLEVSTSPSRTQKKLVALQLDTNPWGSSIKASSARASIASHNAMMRFRRLCEFSRISNMSAGVQRMDRRVQTQAALQEARSVRHLVFGHDDDAGAADGIAGILVRCGLDPAGYHEPQVHAIVHVVGGEQPAQFGNQGRALESDIQANALRSPVQAIQVLIQEEERTLVQAQPFPYPVAHHETAVEYGDGGGVARHQTAIEIDQRVGVARIGGEILASGHQDAVAGGGTGRKA